MGSGHWITGPEIMASSIGSNQRVEQHFQHSRGFVFEVNSVRLHKTLSTDDTNAAQNEVLIVSASPEEIVYAVVARPTTSSARAEVKGYIEVLEVPDRKS